MTAALTSIKVRFHQLDRGAHRTGWTRLPVAALVWTAAMIATAAFTWTSSWHLRPSVNQTMAWSAQQTLDGQLWRTVTATVLTRDLFMISSLLVTTAAYLWLLQRFTSIPVALGTWTAGAIWGFAGTSIFLWLCGRAGWGLATATLATSDYGPSAGTSAVAALVVVLMRHRLVTIASIAILLVGSALHHQVADVEHIVSFMTVLLLGPLALEWIRPPTEYDHEGEDQRRDPE